VDVREDHAQQFDAVVASNGPHLPRTVHLLAGDRRRRLTVATPGVAAVAATAAVTAPWGSNGTETLSPAPTAAQPSVTPSDGLQDGEALPQLDVPPCVVPGGFRRIHGVSGERRGPERLQDSVQEDMSLGTGFVPEVERALVDTAPSSASIDCASSGTVVFVVATTAATSKAGSAWSTRFTPRGGRSTTRGATSRPTRHRAAPACGWRAP
jgi:hypothetical protein